MRETAGSIPSGLETQAFVDLKAGRKPRLFMQSACPSLRLSPHQWHKSNSTNNIGMSGLRKPRLSVAVKLREELYRWSISELA